MPAIKFYQRSAMNTSVANHYRNFIAYVVTTLNRDGKEIFPQWMGFICNAGAAHLKGGKIVRLRVVAISCGDGTVESSWVEVPDGEFVVGWHLQGGVHHGDFGVVYTIIDDNGWPLTTAKNYLPPNKPNAELLFLDTAKGIDSKLQNKRA